MTTPARSAADPLVENSRLYRDFLAEREEVLKHKWIRSEQAGKDIGFEKALLDWMRNHRSDWREERAAQQPPTETCRVC